MNETYKKIKTYSVWITLILFVMRCIYAGYDFRNALACSTFIYDMFSYAGEAIMGTTVIMMLFNKYAWKWKWINEIVDIPVLAEQYSGTFISDWQNENRQFSAYLEVKQTFLNVFIIFRTGESKSYSVLAAITDVGGKKRINYLYENEPRAELFYRSTNHKGTAELWIEDNGELTGNYYTNRKTGGSMRFIPANKPEQR